MKKLIQKFGIAAIVAITLLGLGAPGRARLASGNESNMKTVEVNIDNFTFGSMTLTVPPGTTVTWINKDDVPHTVVSTDKVFASPVLDTDEKYSYTFTKPGTYPYYCSVHPKMTAKVVVK